MGMDATARLWYGVYGDVPEAAYEELTEPKDNPYGEKVVNGIHIHMVWCNYEPIGAGGTVAHSYWGDKTGVDFTRMNEVKAAVDSFLDEYAVPGDRAWYLAADFS